MSNPRREHYLAPAPIWPRQVFAIWEQMVTEEEDACASFLGDFADRLERFGRPQPYVHPETGVEVVNRLHDGALQLITARDWTGLPLLSSRAYRDRVREAIDPFLTPEEREEVERFFSDED